MMKQWLIENNILPLFLNFGYNRSYETAEDKYDSVWDTVNGIRKYVTWNFVIWSSRVVKLDDRTYMEEEISNDFVGETSYRLEGGSPTSKPSNWAHSNDALSLFTGWSSSFLFALLPTVSHMLLECPRYGECRRTFNLQGTELSILRDNHGSESSLLAFLNGIRVNMVI